MQSIDRQLKRIGLGVYCGHDSQWQLHYLTVLRIPYVGLSDAKFNHEILPWLQSHAVRAKTDAPLSRTEVLQGMDVLILALSEGKDMDLRF
jgi:hypothetical protein